MAVAFPPDPSHSLQHIRIVQSRSRICNRLSQKSMDATALTDDATSEDPSLVPDEQSVGNICERYEALFEYIRVIRRPLTCLEQRAFIHALDLTDYEHFPGWYHASECICVDLLPTIVQAIEPDPIDCTVAKRDMNGIRGIPFRGFKALLPAFQGIVMQPKIKADHARELLARAQEFMEGFSTLARELQARADHLGYEDPKAMMLELFPGLREFAGRNGKSEPCKRILRKPSGPRMSSDKGKVFAAIASWQTVENIAMLTGVTTASIVDILASPETRLRLQVRQMGVETEYRIKK